MPGPAQHSDPARRTSASTVAAGGFTYLQRVVPIPPGGIAGTWK